MTIAKKSLGQNFLMHARIAERIARVAPLGNEGVVFEIGPGTGMLTRELLKVARQVIAVEADEELFRTLENTFASEIAAGRLLLTHGDIRTFDITSLPTGYALVANIPYYLTGEIFRMFLESHHQPRSMTLLVQKEVAERIAPKQLSSRAAGRTAGGGFRRQKESILSLSVKAYGTPKYEFTVPRGAFLPAPKVDSAVLTVCDISRKNFSTNTLEGQTFQKEKLFFELIRAGFAHKRKFVRKNLAEAGLAAGDIPLNAASGEHALPVIAEKARAEDLSVEVWLALARSL